METTKAIRLREIATGLMDYAQANSDEIAEEVGRPLGPTEPWASWAEELRDIADEIEAPKAKV